MHGWKVLEVVLGVFGDFGAGGDARNAFLFLHHLNVDGFSRVI